MLPFPPYPGSLFLLFSFFIIPPLCYAGRKRKDQNSPHLLCVPHFHSRCEPVLWLGSTAFKRQQKKTPVCVIRSFSVCAQHLKETRGCEGVIVRDSYGAGCTVEMCTCCRGRPPPPPAQPEMF